MYIIKNQNEAKKRKKQEHYVILAEFQSFVIMSRFIQ